MEMRFGFPYFSNLAENRSPFLELCQTVDRTLPGYSLERIPYLIPNIVEDIDSE